MNLGSLCILPVNTKMQQSHTRPHDKKGSAHLTRLVHSIQGHFQGQWFQHWGSQAQIWLHGSSYYSHRTQWIFSYFLFYMREVILMHKLCFYKNKNEIQSRFLNIKQDKLNSCEVILSGMSSWWSLFPNTLLSTVEDFHPEIPI
jgi:hypothetical protein